MSSSLLVIENDESLLLSFEHFLSEAGFETFTATNFDDAVKIISSRSLDTIVADIILEGKSGIDILKVTREKGVDCPFVIMTGYPEVETASEAVRMNAFDYLIKPVEKDTLLRIARTATEHYRLKKDNERYRNNLDAIFSCVQEGICFVDRQMNLVEANESFREICELHKWRISYSRDPESLPCSGHCLDVLKETVETEKPVRINRIECSRNKRKEQVVTITTSPLFNGKKELTGAIAVLRDETAMVELEKKQTETAMFPGMIGSCEKMKEVFSIIKVLSSVKTATTVLITGESGTGKDLIAEAIHKSSSRAQERFEKVDCPSLAGNILESELFGHVRGAFTGAVNDHMGKFEHAQKGTVFLNEITELSLEHQTKLLRVLNDKVVQRVGKNEPVEVDVRIIAATNRNLHEAVRNKEFREDLYYRLNVIKIKIPPLRDRDEDIIQLAYFFMKTYADSYGKKIEGISDEVKELFLNYEWPGNVRQLKHCIEHAALMCPGTVITHADLPGDIREGGDGKNIQPIDCFITTDDAVTMVKNCDGNKAEAARRLNISRQTLYRKLTGNDEESLT
jgi:two-component system, NtrC family, response regulator HydG